MAQRSVHKRVPMKSMKVREAEADAELGAAKPTTTTNQSLRAAFAAERSEQAEFDLTLRTPGKEKSQPGSGQCGMDGAIDVDMVFADARKTRKPPAAKVRWSVSSKLAAVRLASRHGTYRKVGGKNNALGRGWVSLYAESRKPPLSALFAGRADTQIKGHLRRKRKSNAQAALQLGVSTPQLDGDEALLDKEVGNLVDAIAAESLEIAKRLSLDKETAEAEEARVHEARSRGLTNCRPGANAIPFPVPDGSQSGSTGVGGPGDIGGSRIVPTNHSYIHRPGPRNCPTWHTSGQSSGGSGSGGGEGIGGRGGGGGVGSSGSGRERQGWRRQSQRQRPR